MHIHSPPVCSLTQADGCKLTTTQEINVFRLTARLPRLNYSSMRAIVRRREQGSCCRKSFVRGRFVSSTRSQDITTSSAWHPQRPAAAAELETHGCEVYLTTTYRCWKYRSVVSLRLWRKYHWFWVRVNVWRRKYVLAVEQLFFRIIVMVPSHEEAHYALHVVCPSVRLADRQSAAYSNGC